MDDPRTEYLERPLTDPEVTARGDHLARLLGEIDRKEQAKKRATKEASGEIAALDSEAAVIAREIRQRTTLIEAEVSDERNPEDGTIDTVRADTGEVIRSRPMTPEERQLNIEDHPRRRRSRSVEDAADRLVASGDVTITGTGDSPLVDAVVEGAAKANERKARKKAKDGDEASA